MCGKVTCFGRLGSNALSPSGMRACVTEPAPALLGYEAAFGPLRAASVAAPEAGEQPQHRPEAEREAAAPRLAEIWDAPSHALPPLNMLAEMSLEAMLAGLAH